MSGSSGKRTPFGEAWWRSQLWHGGPERPCPGYVRTLSRNESHWHTLQQWIMTISGGCGMKSRVFCSFAMCLSMTMAAQVKKTRSSQARPSQSAMTATQKAIENQKAIDAVTAELNATMAQNADISAQLTALDKSDAELKKSDQTQIDTSQMVQKQLDKLKHETLPAIQSRANAWDVKRQNHISSGCPAEGGVMPVDQANRCNAETDALMAERAKILSDANFAMKQGAEYE